MSDDPLDIPESTVDYRKRLDAIGQSTVRPRGVGAGTAWPQDAASFFGAIRVALRK